MTRIVRTRPGIGSSPGRYRSTGARLLSTHDVKGFDGPGERSHRPLGADPASSGSSV